MKLVSTTLVSPHSSPENVERAFASVAKVVDECLFLDTGKKESSELLTAAQRGAPLKIQYRRIGWKDPCDFAWARNQALDFASARNADWATFVDSDETVTHDQHIRRLLERLQEPMASLMDDAKTYEQIRYVKIPAVARYHGMVHEAIGTGPILPGSFWGAPKTEEQSRHKNERDFAALREQIKREPESGRWRYYLGQTLELMGRRQEAIQAFEQCVHKSRWDEEIAFAAYQAAAISMDLSQYETAARFCRQGIEAHAGIPELWARLAQAKSWMGDYAQAIRFGRIALSIPRERRTGFRNIEWSSWGILNVLEWTYAKVGNEQGVAEIKAMRATEAMPAKDAIASGLAALNAKLALVK
jgi:tetratricopeptide (TPR) repeat protein